MTHTRTHGWTHKYKSRADPTRGWSTKKFLEENGHPLDSLGHIFTIFSKCCSHPREITQILHDVTNLQATCDPDILLTK